MPLHIYIFITVDIWANFGPVLTNLIEPEVNSQIKQIKDLVTLRGLW